MPPEDPQLSRLLRLSLLDRDEILRYKWLESEKLRHDIGLPQAIRECLHTLRAIWLSKQSAT